MIYMCECSSLSLNSHWKIYREVSIIQFYMKNNIEIFRLCPSKIGFTLYDAVSDHSATSLRTIWLILLNIKSIKNCNIFNAIANIQLKYWSFFTTAILQSKIWSLLDSWHHYLKIKSVGLIVFPLFFYSVPFQNVQWHRGAHRTASHFSCRSLAMKLD